MRRSRRGQHSKSSKRSGSGAWCFAQTRSALAGVADRLSEQLRRKPCRCLYFFAGAKCAGRTSGHRTRLRHARGQEASERVTWIWFCCYRQSACCCTAATMRCALGGTGGTVFWCSRREIRTL
ncbi:hypothetical protein TRVL_01835 [Trypanosoma vivax]|nr:hypothetical protein TRVL_01835 [Trypanosoma vivax]